MAWLREHLERLVRPVRYDQALTHVEYALDALERVPLLPEDRGEILEHLRAARHYLRDEREPRG